MEPLIPLSQNWMGSDDKTLLASFLLKIICFSKSSNTGPPFQILFCRIILLQPELLPCLEGR